MDRRGFLSGLFAGAAAVAAPSVAMGTQKIWVPSAQPIAVPERELEIARALVAPGQMVFGYLIEPRMAANVNLLTLAGDAMRYFPANAPVMILSNDAGVSVTKAYRPFARFRFVGGKEEAISYMRASVIGGFENAQRFGWVAMNPTGYLRD